MTDRVFSMTKTIPYTVLEITLVQSRKVTLKTTTAIKMRAAPSVIHSMVIILLLSVDMSPNPLTTDRVGNRWAMPQKSRRQDAIYSKI
jgi:hypothetical protein